MTSVRNYTFVGAFLFGMGLIGMLDGIVFHQLLQWHSTYMLTNRFNQIVSDGLLHTFTTLLIVCGTLILWRDPRRPDFGPVNQTFLAGMLLGAGTFNLIEGIVDHHLLQIHHVRPGHPLQLEYDLAFDLLAILLLTIGGILFYKTKRRLPTD